VFSRVVWLDLANPTDLWVPFSAMTEEFRGERSMLTNPRQRWLNLLGRTRPGVSLAAAEEAANLALGRFIMEVEQQNRGVEIIREIVGYLDSARLL